MILISVFYGFRIVHEIRTKCVVKMSHLRRGGTELFATTFENDASHPLHRGVGMTAVMPNEPRREAVFTVVEFFQGQCVQQPLRQEPIAHYV